MTTSMGPGLGAPPRPAGRPPSPFVQHLCRLSGTDPYSSDSVVRRGIAASCLLLVIAVMAMGSGALFAHDLVGLSWRGALALGIAWGVAVLMIDRGVLVFMSDARGVRRVVTGVVRLLMAALLGYVVAEPLVLRIFEKEIAVELAQDRAEKVKAALETEATNPDYGDAAIATLQTRVDDLRDASAAQADPAVVNADPEVQRLRDELEAAEVARNAQQDLVECESDGSCGTGNAGDGPEWQRKLDELSRLDGEVARVREELAAAEQAARDRADAIAMTTADGASTDLPAAQEVLAAALVARKAADDKAKEEANKLDGLGARMEALDELREESHSINREYILITLLLIVIDTSAVMLKLLQRPTAEEEQREIARRGELERARADLEHLRNAQADEHEWDRNERSHDRDAMSEANAEGRTAYRDDVRRDLDSTRSFGPHRLHQAADVRQRQRLGLDDQESAGTGDDEVIDIRNPA